MHSFSFLTGSVSIFPVNVQKHPLLPHKCVCVCFVNGLSVTSSVLCWAGRQVLSSGEQPVLSSNLSTLETIIKIINGWLDVGDWQDVRILFSQHVELLLWQSIILVKLWRVSADVIEQAEVSCQLVGVGGNLFYFFFNTQSFSARSNSMQIFDWNFKIIKS